MDGILNETFYLLVPGASKEIMLTATVFICFGDFVFCGVYEFIVHGLFSTNARLIRKPDSWFLLAKC